MTHRRTAGVVVGALCLPLALVAPAAASSTANEVVFTSDRTGAQELWLRDLGARRETRVPVPVTAGMSEPELSPNGSTIAWSSGDFFNGGISVVSRNGGTPRALTSPPGTGDAFVVDTQPTWLPGGTSLLFTRYFTDRETFDTDSQLMTVPLAGGAEQVVPGGQRGVTPDVSVDGRLAFSRVSAEGDPELVVMDLDGTDVLELGYIGFEPAWSPDGSRLAFVSFAGDSTQLTVSTSPVAPSMSVVDLSRSRLDTGESITTSPSWLPDGQSLVHEMWRVIDGEPQTSDLHAVDVRDTRSGRIAGQPADEDRYPFVHGPALSSVEGGQQSVYRPVPPQRILDTRPAPDNVGAPVGRLGAGSTVSLQVRGPLPDGVSTVPDNATAVVLNVTAIGATQSTDIRVYPSGTPVPGASSLNAIRFLAVPNLVTTPIGADGAVVLRNGAGTVDLAADIAGYYVPVASGGSGYTAVAPARLFDTRPAPDNVGTSVGRISGGGTRDLQVVGTLPNGDGGTTVVPADATAVVLNVTVTAPSASTDIRVYPTPSESAPPPLVSNLNTVTGLTAANLVTVAVGAGGKVRIRNNSGLAHVIADLAGYYTASGGDRFVAVAPTRFLDTRDGTGAAPVSSGPQAVLDLKLAGSRGVPTSASAAVLNITVTGVTAGTDVRAYPTPSLQDDVPTVSNLNVPAGVTRANLAVVKPGADGRVRVRNNSGSLALIGDLAGYFLPAV